VRILHVSSEYPPLKIFGLGRYVSDLSCELASQGHQVHVLTNSLGGSDQHVLEKGVQVHRIDFPPPPMPPTPGAPALAFNVHLQQLAHSLGPAGLGHPEVVVSHDWLTAIAGHRIAGRLDIPHLWTVHDLVHGKRFGVIQDVEDRVAHCIERWATQVADLIVVNSIAIGEEIALVHGADRRRVELLHPGIALAQSDVHQSEARLKAFKSCLAPAEEFLITFAGRLDLEKGVDTLINAFSILRTQIPRVRLAIAGRGVLQPAIEEHIKKLKLDEFVTLCGYLEGQVLRSFYRASDLHVCPSHYEPFGLVALEAMAAGAPVIVSDTGGLKDIVSTPKIGRRVQTRDPHAFAHAMYELLSNPSLRAGIARAGRAHARTHFSWNRLARRAIEVFDRALGSKRAMAV